MEEISELVSKIHKRGREAGVTWAMLYLQHIGRINPSEVELLAEGVKSYMRAAFDENKTPAGV